MLYLVEQPPHCDLLRLGLRLGDLFPLYAHQQAHMIGTFDLGRLTRPQPNLAASPVTYLRDSQLLPPFTHRRLYRTAAYPIVPPLTHPMLEDRGLSSCTFSFHITRLLNSINEFVRDLNNTPVLRGLKRSRRWNFGGLRDFLISLCDPTRIARHQ